MMFAPSRPCEAPRPERREPRRSGLQRQLLVFLLAGAPAGCGSESAEEPSGPPSYTLLSETGLYDDPAALLLARGTQEFAPAFALWSDGADKRRWIELPEGTAIDSSDMNRWSFPIGTKLWKEFSLGGVRLETRLIERYGPAPGDYWMGAFVWAEDQGDAVLAPEGQADVLGTAHDAPSQERCSACHNGEPGRVLGFSALQLGAALPESAPLTLSSLAAQNRLGSPLPEPLPAPPGDAPTAAALGYLHANCGHCHNPRGTSWPDTQMLLRLGVEEHDAPSTGLYQSVIGQRLQAFRDGEGLITLRVDAGQPETSGVVTRMQVRGPMQQMPPLASEVVDAAGVELVSAWVTSLGG